MDGDSAARILVVRLGSMGDILHALPAVAAVRRTYPAASIGWAVEQRWAALLAAPGAMIGPRGPQKPLVDVAHTFNTLTWRAELFVGKTWREAAATIGALRQQHYDLAIDFQGAFKSALVAQLSRAPRRVGFAQPREKPATLFYTHLVFPRGRHIVEQNLSLVGQLLPAEGGRATQISFPLPHHAEAELACERELRARRFGDFAILNPGAGWGAKCWPADRYAEVARALCTDGLRSVVNFGPGEEELARMVESASGGAAVAIAASVGELIAFSRRARLFVGGDTGPMHLAAALGVPVVALFGPTDPARNGPYSQNSVVLRNPISQTRTSHRPQPDQGLLQISAAEVIAAARELLGAGR